MRTIFALNGCAGTGKTQTLFKVAAQLSSTENCRILRHIERDLNDQTLVLVSSAGIKIGIETQGKPQTFLEKRLDDLIIYDHCDLLITAVRTAGETYSAILNVQERHNCQVVWTTPYRAENPSFRSLFPTLKARQMVETLTTLNLF